MQETYGILVNKKGIAVVYGDPFDVIELYRGVHSTSIIEAEEFERLEENQKKECKSGAVFRVVDGVVILQN